MVVRHAPVLAALVARSTAGAPPGGAVPNADQQLRDPVRLPRAVSAECAERDTDRRWRGPGRCHCRGDTLDLDGDEQGRRRYGRVAAPAGRDDPAPLPRVPPRCRGRGAAQRSRTRRLACRPSARSPRGSARLPGGRPIPSRACRGLGSFAWAETDVIVGRPPTLAPVGPPTAADVELSEQDLNKIDRILADAALMRGASRERMESTITQPHSRPW
jgi:hypothetical protein